MAGEKRREDRGGRRMEHDMLERVDKKTEEAKKEERSATRY